ncbi:hypothetical protein, partial [Mycobacterium basiliense]
MRIEAGDGPQWEIHQLAGRAGHRLGGLVNGQRGQLSRLVGRALLSLAASALAVGLLAPTAS